MKIIISNRGQFIACILAFLFILFAVFMNYHNTDIAMILCTIAIFLNFYWTIEYNMWVVGVISVIFFSGLVWFVYETMYGPKDNLWHPIDGVWCSVAFSTVVTIVASSIAIEIDKNPELEVK